MRRVLAVLAFAALAASLTVASGSARINPSVDNGPKSGPHDLAGPLAIKQRELRKAALQLQLEGKIAKGAKVAQIGGKKGKKGKKPKGQFVELARVGEDKIWTVLAEFGTQQATHNHGALGVIAHGGDPGPAHNEIPEPDRSEDNTTIWAPDFSPAYFERLLFSEEPGFSSMRNHYLENSSGRYAVNGDVTDWVHVPFNEAAYGSNYCGSIVCVRDIQRLLEDSLNGWYNAQVAAGKTQAQIDAYLSQFDVWDRYDYNGNGNFNEPDGYIDHFQSVHAGEGEETGGGAQGEDAIWSHRSYTNIGAIGVQGPVFNMLGGTHVGNSSYWVGDYTIEPENGGVGVFSHEFGHDLGLPDEYDTSGNTGGAENSTGFWTPWSSGSYGNDGSAENGIGNRPFEFSAWDKLFLGWLDYAGVNIGDKNTNVKLGPSAFNNTSKQGIVVNLPDRQVSTHIASPFAGSKFYYSDAGDDIDVAMTRSVALPAGAQLSAKALYNIELDWDYAYLIVSTDGGAHWSTVHTNLSTNESPNGQNFGEGITGVSTGGGWVDLTADLSAYGGQTVLLGFEYWTDGAVQGTDPDLTAGFSLDEIAVTGQPVDGAETAAGWTFSPATGGFRATTGDETTSYFNAYVVENRQYVGSDRLRVGFDSGLKTGPYNFGGTVGPNWAERFPYQDGVVIWYWNSQYANNNVGDHPGEGEILPVDAHPALMHWSDGSILRPRLQAYDSTFGVEKTDAITLHKDGVATSFRSLPGVPVFDDVKSWWTSADAGDALGHYQAAWAGVNVPKTGTQINVKGPVSWDGYVNVEVKPAK
jgi:immune inhibitor A